VKLPRQPSRRPVQVSLTSLIDVLFILIIFFTVSSTWKEQPVLELDLPAAGTASAQPVEDVVITIDAAGRIYFGETPIDEEHLGPELERALVPSGDPPPVLIAADQEAPHGAVVRVLDAARARGARRVLISARMPSQD